MKAFDKLQCKQVYWVANVIGFVCDLLHCWFNRQLLKPYYVLENRSLVSRNVSWCDTIFFDDFRQYREYDNSSTVINSASPGCFQSDGKSPVNRDLLTIANR